MYEPTARIHVAVVFSVLGTIEFIAEWLCRLNVVYLNHCLAWFQGLMSMKEHNVENVSDIVLQEELREFAIDVLHYALLRENLIGLSGRLEVVEDVVVELVGENSSSCHDDSIP